MRVLSATCHLVPLSIHHRLISFNSRFLFFKASSSTLPYFPSFLLQGLFCRSSRSRVRSYLSFWALTFCRWGHKLGIQDFPGAPCSWLLVACDSDKSNISHLQFAKFDYSSHWSTTDTISHSAKMHFSLPTSAILLLSLFSSLIVAYRPIQFVKHTGQSGRADQAFSIVNYYNATTQQSDAYIRMWMFRYKSSASGWASLAFGPRMFGSLMFIIYGINITYGSLACDSISNPKFIILYKYKRIK